MSTTDAQTSNPTRVRSFSITSTYQPLKYRGEIPPPERNVDFTTPRRGRRPNKPPPAARPPPTESMDGVARTLLDALRHAANAAGITAIDERILQAPLMIDMGGLLWNVRELYLFEMPVMRELGMRLHGESLRQVGGRIPKTALCLPAMITQLLTAVVSSAEVRAALEDRTVVALGWNSIKGFSGYPALSFKGTPRLLVVEDPLSAEYVFAFANS